MPPFHPTSRPGLPRTRRTRRPRPALVRSGREPDAAFIRSGWAPTRTAAERTRRHCVKTPVCPREPGRAAAPSSGRRTLTNSEARLRTNSCHATPRRYPGAHCRFPLTADSHLRPIPTYGRYPGQLAPVRRGIMGNGAAPAAAHAPLRREPEGGVFGVLGYSRGAPGASRATTRAARTVHRYIMREAAGARGCNPSVLVRIISPGDAQQHWASRRR